MVVSAAHTRTQHQPHFAANDRVACGVELT